MCLHFDLIPYRDPDLDWARLACPPEKMEGHLMAAIFFESKLFYKISPGVSRQGEEFQDQVKRVREPTPD